MSRRFRRNGNSDTNISMYVIGGIAVIVVIAFVISYVVYTNSISKQARLDTNESLGIANQTDDSQMINMITNEQNSEAVSSSIGRTVNEMENAEVENQEVESTNKMAVNTSNTQDEQNEETNQEVNETSTNEESNVVEETPVVQDPTFAKPVEGEVLKDYSKDNLTYSNTLDEWTTHLGIDYVAEKTDIVKASADGTIKSIKNDPRYGLTVVIEHANGFESVYSSLLTAEFVSVGEEVKQGQTIATVGNTATFEIADETHLHFEIKKDGENVDPNIYIK